MSDTPSGQIVASAQQPREIKDGRGRVLRLRNLGALDRARLFKAIGPAQASNEQYTNMAFVAAMVTHVDGIPLGFPTKDAEVESAIAFLDDDGLNAVAQDYADRNKPAVPGEAPAGGTQPAPSPVSPT